MKFGISVGWVLVRGVGAGVGRGVLNEVDIGVGNEVGGKVVSINM